MKQYRLKNGLTVYFCPDSTKHSIFFSLIVRYGGMDGQFQMDGVPYQMKDGMAHFLEHYVLEESELGHLMNQFGKLYLKANGYTYSTHTHFFLDGVKNVEEGIRLLLTGVHKVSFTSEQVEETKCAIREEIRMRQDQKATKIRRASYDQTLVNWSYRSVSGDVVDVDQMAVSDVKRCYQAFYRPDNEFVVVAGNFEEEKMLALIEECYQTLSFEDHTVEKRILEEPMCLLKNHQVISLPTAEPVLNLTFKIDLQHCSKERLLQATFYWGWMIQMNFGRMSSLHQSLLERQIIKDRLLVDVSYFPTFCLFSVGAYTTRLEELKEALLKTVHSLHFDQELMELFQKNDKLLIALREERLDSIVFPLVDNIVCYDHEALDTIADIEALSFSDFCSFFESLSFDLVAVTEVEDLA